MSQPTFIPAAVMVARGTHRERTEARVSRCTDCGQWTWDGFCTLHPIARQDTY